MADLSPLSVFSTQLLSDELARRQSNNGSLGASFRPACSSGSKQGTYDTTLHVLALFLILTLSTVACGIPLFSRKASKTRQPGNIIFFCQHFGTGVLIATAFVHLLPTAFVSLTDPCLPTLFSRAYRPMAGLVAMISALVVVFIESYLATRGAGHSHGHTGSPEVWQENLAGDDDDDVSHHHQQTQYNRRSRSYSNERPSLMARVSSHKPQSLGLGVLETETRGLIGAISPLSESGGDFRMNGIFNVLRRDEADQDLDELDFDEQPLDREGLRSAVMGRELPMIKVKAKTDEVDATYQSHTHTSEEQQRLMLQCILLEAGILFHSIFIGMALSVATGPTFLVFLIAISFHQVFEGLALGTRIAAIQFPADSLRPWLMVVAFGATTPLGQAIGLVLHNLYDPRSQTGLLMVGFMNALSSGMLLFAGLVQLLAEDFLSEKSYQVLMGRRRRYAFLAIVAGATLMAGVGAFA